MKEILEKMSRSEYDAYAEYIKIFTSAMNKLMFFEEITEEERKTLREKIDSYIEFMKKYINDLRFPEELGDIGMRFFIIQEVNRIYSER